LLSHIRFDIILVVISQTLHNRKGVCHISLADIRRKRGLSQDQLAKLSGVHRVTIARFETGKISPKLKTLERLAAALGVPIGKIID
jgi:DNA-binding XRE family transcriptional regulator